MQPLDLRLPALDLRLVLVQDRLGLREPRLGRLDVGPATSTTSLASAIRSRSSLTVSPLVWWSSTSSGTNNVASTSSFFTLSPMSTIHFSMNAVGLAKIDVRSYASMKLGWPTSRTIFRDCGWITCTLGGLDALANSILASWPQPGAARAASRPNTSQRRPAVNSETVGQGRGASGTSR